ncbi:MAG: response regulator transcription factor [Pedobacter sp.]|uniref:response regulator transcription factor n=1 Tax=Pedobacter sp. TaxID=1411316 RepID=UPI003563482C
MKILIIEDEIKISETIRRFLESEKYIVESAFDFDSAIGKIALYQYDCILLDIMLPNGSGMDILKEIKKDKKEDAVIILSAKDSVEDKVLGLDLGADDYLSKPFNLLELHARIKSAIRRKNRTDENSINYKNVMIIPDDRRVLVDEVEIILNRKEYDLLYYFMIRPGKTLQKTTLAELVWGDYIVQADSLDFIYSQIKNLRKKLKDNNAEIDFQAVYGIGYKLI